MVIRHSVEKLSAKNSKSYQRKTVLRGHEIHSSSNSIKSRGSKGCFTLVFFFIYLFIYLFFCTWERRCVKTPLSGYTAFLTGTFDFIERIVALWESVRMDALFIILIKYARIYILIKKLTT